MYKITEKQFREMPVELQALYEKLPNHSSDEVLSLFPNTKSGKMGANHTRHTDGSPNGLYGKFDINHPLGETYADSGSAARFFYCAKASKRERNLGCEGLEKKENLQGLDNRGRTIIREDGSKTLVERFGKTPSKNNHPTVKPVALMEYLIKLVSRDGALILDPFAGSGTTGMACRRLGRNFILIEKDQESCEISECRIAAALSL